MRAKLFSLGAGLAVCAAVLAGTTANAGGAADTKVTIKTQNGDFSGTVKSSDPDTCAEGRKVTVFRVRRSGDVKIASDTASRNGNKYEWSTGNTGEDKGKFYARAGKIPGCKKGVSKTVKVER